MPDIKFTVKLSADGSGFYRRQCPACRRQFKLIAGTSLRSAFCPYCGKRGSVVEWHTPTQKKYLDEVVKHQTQKGIGKALGSALRGGPLKIRSTSTPSGPPSVRAEPDDLTIVNSDCHPDQPFKVLDGWSGEVHCVTCGTQVIREIPSPVVQEQEQERDQDMKLSHFPDIVASKLYELTEGDPSAMFDPFWIFDELGVPKPRQPDLEMLLRNDSRFRFLSPHDVGLTADGVQYCEEERPDSVEDFLLQLRGIQSRLSQSKANISIADASALRQLLQAMIDQIGSDAV